MTQHPRSTRIAVAGATGVVGRHVVDVATSRGHEVVPLTRAAGVDLTAGTSPGLEARLAGVTAVVDVTSVPTQDAGESEAFFSAVTRTLVEAEQAAGTGHHVALSIVGIDDVPFGYYAGKRLQERLLREGAQPWSVLRATQFHEFAEALVDLALQGPSGRVPDLAGPEVLPMHRLARRVSRARGLGRVVVAVPVPGVAGRRMRDGSLTPAGDGPRGVVRFGEWLDGLEG